MEKKRNVQKHFELSEYEAKLLRRRAAATGRKECDVIRDLILGYRPAEAPGERFYEAVNEIRKVGVNINQLAHMANATGQVDEGVFKTEAEKLDALILTVRKEALEPRKQAELQDIVKRMKWMIWDTLEEDHECERIRLALVKLMRGAGMQVED